MVWWYGRDTPAAGVVSRWAALDLYGSGRGQGRWAVWGGSRSEIEVDRWCWLVVVHASQKDTEELKLKFEIKKDT
jgi:hypothetical protein